MNVFILSPEAKTELALLKETAEANPFSADMMKRRINGTWAPGDGVKYTCYIPIDYKVVYTIETALERDNLEKTHGMYRQLSMSNTRTGKTPHPLVVQEIMNELGFAKALDSGENKVWSEREGVINIIEFI